MTGNQKCEYRSLNFLVDDQGKDVIPFRSKMSFDDCKMICAQTKGCESFSLCDEACHIKDKVLNGLEPRSSKIGGKCFTTYESCAEGTMFLFYEMIRFIQGITIFILNNYDADKCNIGRCCISLQMKTQFSSVIRCN